MTNPDPKLPALDGLSAGQARVAVKIATTEGLNLTRARALLLAHRARPLRPNETAELDQALARLNSACLRVKATAKPAPLVSPVLARLRPLVQTLIREARAPGAFARRAAAEAGDPRFSNTLLSASAGYQVRVAQARRAAAAAGDPAYQTTTTTKGTTS